MAPRWLCCTRMGDRSTAASTQRRLATRPCCGSFVLVGHSFGGAVVIGAGAESPAVIGVAALSSQTAGTGQVGAISPRPLLLMHGTADEILPAACSRDLYQRAGEPRRLLLYENCRHGLDDCHEAIDRDLLAWIRAVVQGTIAAAETDV